MKNTKELKKMDKDLKAKWIKALLSGKYKQGFGCLKNHGKFCCLGVLADIQGKLGKNLDKDNFACSDKNLGGFFGEYYNYNASYILTLMNDEEVLYQDNITRRKDFKEIADWIEEYL